MSHIRASSLFTMGSPFGEGDVSVLAIARGETDFTERKRRGIVTESIPIGGPNVVAGISDEAQVSTTIALSFNGNDKRTNARTFYSTSNPIMLLNDAQVTTHSC
ncbi:hypothetical protein M514_07222 [Trichuris suis]|uniref:Uncharacterized protein n=1 Tax=Trichuris suis TaxID=68888 RepID=A0A085M3U7_9BILA|nr:hypothetical protein M513_07222 [Trichuris suis]KFD67041.1 hypothetical protein M514_07222 [Trichuris suis]